MELYYKSIRIIDGKPKWVIVDECNNIINMSPNNEDIKLAIDEKYIPKRCCMCGNTETYIKSNGVPDWRKYPDVTNWDGKSYSCKKCYGKDYQKLPDSQNNLIKLLRDFRIGNVKKNSIHGFIIISQAVTAKVLKIEDLNIKMNNFNWYIDMEHEKYRKIDVKSRSLNYGMWSFSTRKKIDCDTNFCLGFDIYRENIASIYIIPNDDVMHNTGITIAKDSSRTPKYDKFKVDPKPYNDAYHSLMSFLKDNVYFGIENIRKWLESD